MDDLVADLLRPESYPPPRPSAVVLCSTHISWVFLTDREAWKVKRPVNYGFVDYSTPERRRHFCEEEVRLNRRLAPEVYQSVEAVRRDARGHSFSRGGEAVDWAVRMGRLPEEASAEALAHAGRLTHDHLERLAGTLARFYAAAPPSEGSYLDAFRQNVRENFEQTRPFAGTLLDLETFRSVRAWQEETLAASASAIAARRARDGHGDLRLEHVYFVEDEPWVIDCIEFNPRFRQGDAASDVAFLAMELDLHGQGPLGEAFLGRFALEANDYDFYPLLDLYLSYRAWVRAKVACFVAAEPGTDGEKRRRKIEEARSLSRLALSYARAERKPRLVAVGGMIGSGKSSLARELSRRLGFAVVSSDLTRKHLAGLSPRDPAPEEIYSAEWTARAYAEMRRRAGEALRSGRGAILDATFVKPEGRLAARDLARRHGAPFLFVEARADEATLRERLRRRAAEPSVSDAREELLDRWGNRFEPARELGERESLVVDSARPLERSVEDILHRLRNFPPP